MPKQSKIQNKPQKKLTKPEKSEIETEFIFKCKEKFQDYIRSFETKTHPDGFEKRAISQTRLNDWIKSINKGTSNQCYYYDKKYAVLNSRLLDSNGRLVLPLEEMFDKCMEVHKKTGYKCRTKIEEEAKQKYSNITRDIIETFIFFTKNCKEYISMTNSRIKHKTPETPETPETPDNVDEIMPEVNDPSQQKIAQVFMIDMQNLPDGEFKWILNYQDLSTGKVYLRALKANSFIDIAQALCDLFYQHGEPTKLNCFDCKELNNIEEFKKIWSSLLIAHESLTANVVNYIEERKREIQKTIEMYVHEREINKWSFCLGFVQSQINNPKMNSQLCSNTNQQGEISNINNVTIDNNNQISFANTSSSTMPVPDYNQQINQSGIQVFQDGSYTSVQQSNMTNIHQNSFFNASPLTLSTPDFNQQQGNHSFQSDIQQSQPQSKTTNNIQQNNMPNFNNVTIDNNDPISFVNAWPITFSTYDYNQQTCTDNLFSENQPNQSDAISMDFIRNDNDAKDFYFGTIMANFAQSDQLQNNHCQQTMVSNNGNVDVNEHYVPKKSLDKIFTDYQDLSDKISLLMWKLNRRMISFGFSKYKMNKTEVMQKNDKNLNESQNKAQFKDILVLRQRLFKCLPKVRPLIKGDM